MEYPHYSYPVESLFTGASFGNYDAFARLDEQTNLKGLWSSVDNQYYVGEWDIDLLVRGKKLSPKDTMFFPESQTTVFSDGGVTIEKQFFLPYVSEEHGMASAAELRTAVFLVRISNLSSDPVEVGVRHQIYFPANLSEKFTKQPSREQTEKRVKILQDKGHCEVVTAGNPSEVRIFGSTIPWMFCEGDDKALVAEYRVGVRGNQNLEVPFVITFSPNGRAEAWEGFRRCNETKNLHDQAVRNYKEILSRTFIFTPEPLINRGFQWAKVNTVRVQHRYRIGEGFTNDPPQDIVVLRDLAWYVLGSDYLTPTFSRSILSLAEQCAMHDDGKVTEYIHAGEDPAVLHDYNLNINDDTPLVICALYHHAVTSEDDSYLLHVYPLMARACNHILSQINDGLVRCYAEGTNVWGICSWRNIIDGYNLTGAVTEINAECYRALSLTAEVAKQLGISYDEVLYAEAADNLKTAINTRLVSEKTGMYLLNLDNNGIPHHDITGDEIFPVLFGVADQNMRKRILEKLTDDEMWTPYGSRTVSKWEENYNPDFGYQLLGGVWHNLTAWVAYCLRGAQPDRLKEGLVNMYRLSETHRPRDFQNVVPGEFPERLHGETFQSRGMAMSPWLPPTYLWLGVEGLLGIKPSMQGLAMNPVLPSDWKWVGVKNLLYKGTSVTAFLYDGILYCTSPIESSFPTEIGAYVETFADNDKMFSIGMKIENEILLFVAADDEVAGNVRLPRDVVRFEKFVKLAKGQALFMRVPTEQAVSQENTFAVRP
ncbi:MAG: amylo-alpha-1,6-glucosidase [Bacteroidota bacterium]|jgi:hypothetical protein